MSRSVTPRSFAVALFAIAAACAISGCTEREQTPEGSSGPTPSPQQNQAPVRPNANALPRRPVTGSLRDPGADPDPTTIVAPAPSASASAPAAASVASSARASASSAAPSTVAAPPTTSAPKK